LILENQSMIPSIKEQAGVVTGEKIWWRCSKLQSVKFQNPIRILAGIWRPGLGRSILLEFSVYSFWCLRVKAVPRCACHRGCSLFPKVIFHKCYSPAARAAVLIFPQTGEPRRSRF